MARIKQHKFASSASEVTPADSASSSSTAGITTRPTREAKSLVSATGPSEADKVFEVHRILARSLDPQPGPQGDEYHYLVRWVGFGPKEDTWEPKRNLVHGARSLVTAFDSKGVLPCSHPPSLNSP